MKVQHTATLDFTDNGVFETGWRIKQGDYGNTELVLRLVNNGVNVYDAAITPQIAFRRWDGASVISVMTPNDQTYKYAFAGNELEVPGLTLCDVKFTDAEGRVSTASCRFTVVEDTIGYDPTGAHTYDNPVSELVEQATNAAEVGIESSFKAEGFAVGEQGGVPVGPDSPYYHNNAKWWAQQAGDPIGTAVEEQTTTTGQFTTKTGGKLESCIVAFEPVQSGSGDPSPSNVRPITGHSSVEVWEHGKNMYSDGDVTKNANVTYAIKNLTNPLPSGTYIISALIETTGTPPSIRLSFRTENDSAIFTENIPYSSGNRTSLVVNLTEPAYKIRFYGKNDGSQTDYAVTFKNIQIEKGSRATDYEPYQGQDVTVALGDTYYGGTLDVVSGVLTVDKASVDLGNLSWTYYTGGTNPIFQASVTGAKIYTESVMPNALSECYVARATASRSNFASNANNGEFSFQNNYVTLLIRNTSYSDADVFKTAMTGLKLVYELATPLTIQLTPQQINTLIGENHLDVPLTGQSLDSAVYRELFAWDDVKDVVKAVDDKNADVSAIGTDESGNTTASKAYAQGDIFYKDGFIGEALTAVASGATWTLNTNYKQTTLAEIVAALRA